MEEAFSELEQGELTEEGALVAAAQDSADRAVLVLDETLSRPLSAGGRPAALLQVAASERHIAAAVRDLGEAERLSEADILVEYEGAKAVQRRAVATIIAVVTTGLVLALAGGSISPRPSWGRCGPCGRPSAASATASSRTGSPCDAGTSSASWVTRSTGSPTRSHPRVHPTQRVHPHRRDQRAHRHPWHPRPRRGLPPAPALAGHRARRRGRRPAAQRQPVRSAARR